MAHCSFKILYFESDQENVSLFVKLNVLCYVQENFVYSLVNPLRNLTVVCGEETDYAGYV
jgi:hypothetical protein